MADKSCIIPVKLPADLANAMDQAAFALSKPGALISRAHFIRTAIQEKCDRTLVKGARDKSKKDK